MRTAIAVTLFFAAATSLLGARRNAQLTSATGQRRYWRTWIVAPGAPR